MIDKAELLSFPSKGRFYYNTYQLAQYLIFHCVIWQHHVRSQLENNAYTPHVGISYISQYI